MDLSCSTGHYPNERAVSSVQAPRGRSFAEMAPCVCRKLVRPCAWGWHVKMHSSLSPITGALCSFPANKSVVWPHPVTVSAAPWQAPAAAPVLRAWGRCLGRVHWPIHLLTAMGKQQAVSQQPPRSCKPDGAIRCIFEHLLHLEGVWRLLRCGHMQLMLELLRGGGEGKEYFPAGKKEKQSHDHCNLLCWEKAVIPSQTGTA